MSPRRPCSSARQSVEGHLAIVVLIFLVVTGLLLQGFVQWSLGDERIGQAIDEAAQRRAEVTGLENVVKEALLLHYETGLNATPPAVSTLINEGLMMVTGGGVQSTALPGVPGWSPATFQAPFASYWDGASTSLGGGFSAIVESAQPRALRRLDNVRLPHLPPILVRNGLSDTFTFGFSRASPTALSYRVTARLWQVPITDFEIMAYATPTDGTLPQIARLPSLGTNALSEPAVRAGLVLTALSSGPGAVAAGSVLPASQREIVSLAGINWSYIWSSAFRLALIASLPTEDSVVYDARQLTGELPGGVTADWNNALVTVSVSDVAGNGLYLLSSESALTTVALQQGGGAQTSPLVLYLDGGTSTANRLQVHLLTSLTRPCIIYLVNTNLVSPGSALAITGALLFSPTSTLAGGASLTAPLTLHGAFVADLAAFPNLAGITVLRVFNPSWRGMVPRALVVQADGSVL